MKNLTYQAVIFDMDGVIFDSERIWQAFDREADALFGTHFPPETRHMFCGMDENRIRATLSSLRPGLDVAAYREYVISHVHAYEAERGAELKPGFTDMVSALKAGGKRLALATSSRRSRALALFKKAGLDIDGIFDAVVCREDVRAAKPDPDIFLTAAARLDALPQHTVVLEDSINGIAAAYAGGFTPVMVVDLIPPPPEYLSPPYFLTVVNDLYEAQKYLT